MKRIKWLVSLMLVGMLALATPAHASGKAATLNGTCALFLGNHTAPRHPITEFTARRVVGKHYHRRVIHAVSDKRGNFTFHLQPGTYEINTNSPRRSALPVTITLTKGQTVSLRVWLFRS